MMFIQFCYWQPFFDVNLTTTDCSWYRFISPLLWPYWHHRLNMYFPFVSRPPQTVSFGMRLWTIHPFQRLVLDWHMHHCQFLAEWYLVVGYMEGTIEWWVGRWRSWLSVIWWLDYLRRDGWMVWLNGWLVNEWTFSGLRGNGWFAWEWMVCWWNGWFAGGMDGLLVEWICALMVDVEWLVDDQT